eukprot:scaffold81118_cov62-Phaeocystis_antarctica.AAC.2
MFQTASLYWAAVRTLPERETTCAPPGEGAHYTCTWKLARPTAAFAAALAGMLYRSRFSSAGSAPLLSAAARAAQPASVIWVLLR